MKVHNMMGSRLAGCLMMSEVLGLKWELLCVSAKQHSHLLTHWASKGNINIAYSEFWLPRSLYLLLKSNCFSSSPHQCILFILSHTKRICIDLMVTFICHLGSEQIFPGSYWLEN